MRPPSDALLPEHQETEKAGLQEERKQPFHRQRLTNHPAGILRERCPVRAELELHRDAGHHTDSEVDAEDSNPESGGIIPPLVAGPQTEALQDNDEQRQPHRQLRKQVVIDDRERELQPVPKKGIAHGNLWRFRLCRVWRIALVSHMLKRLFLSLAITLIAPSIAAAQNPAPEQRDFILKDFKFRAGGTLPELKIHYRTFGKPERDSAGVVRNAILIMHGTGGSGAQFIRSEFAGVLFGAG